jgi:hypothetical protein
LLGFQAKRKINESILLQKWQRNNFDAKNNAYETTIFAYSRNLDLLISTNSIIRSDVEKESSLPYPKDVVTNS